MSTLRLSRKPKMSAMPAAEAVKEKSHSFESGDAFWGGDIKDLSLTKVLLVEDDRTTRTLVSSALDPYCNIEAVPDVCQGVTQYAETHPDLLFLDIALPDGDGCNILEWVMRNDPGAYVVMFSGNGDMENIRRAYDLGARGFIRKPFETSQMLYHLNVCPKTH